MAKSDLIIAQAAGYTFAQVEPFLRSLKKTGFEGSVVFFVLESDGILQQRLERSGVQAVVYRNSYPYFADKLYQNSLVVANDGRIWHPASLRFFLYEAWLLAHEGQYERILHSDVRDVVFQRDPFAERWPVGIHVFLENRRLTIGSEPSNAAWIESVFGKRCFQYLASKPIACSGVIFGSGEAWMAFIGVFSRVLSRYGNSGVGIDQGVFNALLHLDSVELGEKRMADPGLVVWEDAEWLVSTESYFKHPRSIRWGLDAKVMNTSDQPVAIIHQYDRNALLCLVWSKRLLLDMLRSKPAYAIKSLVVNSVWWLRCSVNLS